MEIEFIIYNLAIYLLIFLYKINDREHIFQGFHIYLLICFIVTLWNIILYYIGFIDYYALPKI